MQPHADSHSMPNAGAPDSAAPVFFPDPASLRGIIEDAAHGIFVVTGDGQFLFSNRAFASMIGTSVNELLAGTGLLDRIAAEQRACVSEGLRQCLSAGGTGPLCFRCLRPDGSRIALEVYGTRTQAADAPAIICTAADVSERVRSEEALRKLSRAVEQCPASIVITDVSGAIEYVNPQFTRITGYTIEDVLGRNPRMLQSGRTPASVYADLWGTLTAGREWRGELLNRKKNGELYWEHASLSPVRDASGITTHYVAVKEDITEQKSTAEALREANQTLHALFQASPVPIFGLDVEGRVTHLNPAAVRVFGWTEAESLGEPLPIVPEARRGEFQDNVRRVLEGEVFTGHEARRRRKDGSDIDVSISAAPVHNAAGRICGIMSVVDDITDRLRSQKQIRTQFERIAALRAIDVAIMTSVDLDLTLRLVLDQVSELLGAHAADILLLDRKTRTLVYAAGRGFRSDAISGTCLRMGEGMAGRAAAECELVSVTSLADHGESFLASARLEGEGFTSYHAVPLVVKREVRGVLETFHRSPFVPDGEWLTFLEMIAGQAAIAIDSSTLFADFQRSNTELALAYDTTLEGWSRALDLRDKETEGHSRRVTEMTVRLARAMGISDGDIVHMRRGALLHDIGKMGIPDSILLKPGPLTEEEWEVMRRHPISAYELLSPIAFLRSALDIPYCHHEKWDGTGYPRGLKGEQIPLAARIFAAADVWDAMRSERPYRSEWPAPRVRDHIRLLAGTHLDPDVVDTFLRLDLRSPGWEAETRLAEAA